MIGKKFTSFLTTQWRSDSATFHFMSQEKTLRPGIASLLLQTKGTWCGEMPLYPSIWIGNGEPFKGYVSNAYKCKHIGFVCVIKNLVSSGSPFPSIMFTVYMILNAWIGLPKTFANTQDTEIICITLPSSGNYCEIWQVNYSMLQQVNLKHWLRFAFQTRAVTF